MTPQIDFTIPAFGVFINFVVVVAAAGILKFQVGKHADSIEKLEEKVSDLRTRVAWLEAKINGKRN